MEQPPNHDHTASVAYPNYLSQPAKFVHWSLLYRNKHPIDPIFDHIYHCYRPHYPDLPGVVPTLQFQKPLSSSDRLRYTGGFDSAIFSRTWRESGLPKVVPLKMPMEMGHAPCWALNDVYKYMTDATRWVDALLDQAVESQSKITSPKFEASFQEYNLQPPDAAVELDMTSYDRWAARIDFLSEPHVRRFVEHLITNMLIQAWVDRNNKKANRKETGQFISKISVKNLQVEKSPEGEVPKNELPKGKNYKRNQKRSGRHRRKRTGDEQIVTVSGQAVSTVTSTNQNVTSSGTSTKISLTEALVEAGVEVSALNYLMVLVPAGVASSLEKKMPPKAISQATLKRESPTEADTPIKADLKLMQSDDSTTNMAAPTLRTTSTDLENAEVLLDLTPLNLDIQNNPIHIGRPADDDVLTNGSNIDQTLIEDCIDSSKSSESEDSDTPPVLTFDGRNACEVTDLTIEDHPEANKFMEIKFNCPYCQKEIAESHDSETAFLCPGCGPCSAIRYCSKTCMLADAVLHQPICGLQPGDYPVIWNWTPPHMHSKFPYITPIGHEMSPQCFRQMVYAAILDSDGVVTHPYITYYDHKMPEERREAVKARMETPVLTFVSQGDYQIFVTGDAKDDTGDTGHDLTIDMPAEISHQFRRARNAAWLTHDMKLIRFVFHAVKMTVNSYNTDVKEDNWVDFNFVRGFELEFPSFSRFQHRDLVYDTKVNLLEQFEKEWPEIEQLIKDLELEHPILRCWMTDADPNALPSDPATRYTGMQWLRQDPWEEKFIEGDPSREWGIGYNGTMSDTWKFLLPETKDEKAEQAAKEWNTVLHGPKEDGHASWKGFRD